MLFRSGNVRQLENAIERAVVLGGGSQILPADLGLAVELAGPSAAPAAVPSIGSFHDRVEEFKRTVIRGALQATKGNQTRAAAALGLQRTYLARLIRNLALRDPTG